MFVDNGIMKPWRGFNLGVDLSHVEPFFAVDNVPFKANVTTYMKIAFKVNMADVVSIGNDLNMSRAP